MVKLDWKRYNHLYKADTKHIILQSEGITEISWDGCPEDLESLDLSKNRIGKWTWQGVPQTLKSLNLKDNELTEFTLDGFPSSIQDLNLDENYIEDNQQWHNELKRVRRLEDFSCNVGRKFYINRIRLLKEHEQKEEYQKLQRQLELKRQRDKLEYDMAEERALPARIQELERALLRKLENRLPDSKSIFTNCPGAIHSIIKTIYPGTIERNTYNWYRFRELVYMFQFQVKNVVNVLCPACNTHRPTLVLKYNKTQYDVCLGDLSTLTQTNLYTIVKKLVKSENCTLQNILDAFDNKITVDVKRRKKYLLRFRFRFGDVQLYKAYLKPDHPMRQAFENNCVIKIQRACHNWLYSPKCKDGSIGLIPSKHMRDMVAEGLVV